jgi:TolB protein
MQNPSRSDPDPPSAQKRSWPRPLIAAVLGALFLSLGCSLFSPGPTPPPLIFPTLILASPTTAPPLVTAQPTAPLSPGPAGGKIAFTCQVFRLQSADQICIVNADGSGFRRLTTDDHHRHFYASIAPDGQSVVYVSNAAGKKDRLGNVYYDISEINLMTGENHQLTSELGILTAPEISPDGAQIVFTNSDGPHEAIWLMARDGSNAHRIYGSDTVSAWDPTWSPDGKQILFASNAPGGEIQLFIMNVDGSGARQVSSLPDLRGRSDWSSQNQITTYSGTSWAREIFVFTPDNPAATQVSPTGGNGQGPSFSPDGGWVAFTAYYDRFGDANGCEIYLVRIDGSGLTRLTDNDYCDWQPRWGP